LAKKNLKHTQFINQSVESWAKKTKIKGDTVIVDPPRVGLSKSSLEAINKIKPKQIIYVSCDSVTLSRDCKRFYELGYKVEKVKVFDFYPQTSHIETAVVLSL
jgi:23S rRNA (uracil1939-C5)-methyltransferase